MMSDLSIPPLLRTNFTKFLSKKVGASRYLPNAHFGTIKNHVGQNCTIGRQIQKLGILVFVFFAIVAKCPFLLTSSLVKPPLPPMSGFVSISLTPPPLLGCWRHLWKPPNAPRNCISPKNKSTILTKKYILCLPR